MADALRHVACIDDDEDILFITSLALREIGGLTVTTLSNAQDAFDFLGKTNPDLILLDVMMPKMDGPTFLKELKARPLIAEAPVVFMTARIQADDLRHYQALGAAGVVPKPFDPVTLVDELQAVWRDWRATGQSALRSPRLSASA